MPRPIPFGLRWGLLAQISASPWEPGQPGRGEHSVLADPLSPGPLVTGSVPEAEPVVMLTSRA